MSVSVLVRSLKLIFPVPLGLSEVAKLSRYFENQMTKLKEKKGAQHLYRVLGLHRLIIILSPPYVPRKKFTETKLL